MAAPKQLKQLLQGDPRFGALAALCDEYAPSERLEAIRALGKVEMAALFERAAGQPAVSLDYLVPPESPQNATIVWNGKNSLPAFSAFQKIFTRGTEPGTLVGKNNGSMEWLIGPGYYTCVLSPREPGEFLIDYTREPAQPPAGWAPVKKNKAGFSRLVFFNMHDFLRPVGKNVAIGAAYDVSGKFKNLYFTLARGEQNLNG